MTARHAYPPPAIGRHVNLGEPAMTEDRQTITPSAAELWVRYHRKVIISFASVLAAFFALLHDATQTSAGLTWVTVIAAALAVGQSIATYFPGSATAKLAGSLIFAVAGAVNGAIAEHFTLATVLVVLVQVTTWVAAGATENGPEPRVARAGAVDAGTTFRPAPE